MERKRVAGPGAEEGGLSSALNAFDEEGGLARPSSLPTPTGDMEVGGTAVRVVRVDRIDATDTAVRVVRVSRNNDVSLADMRLAFIREFERVLEEQLNQHPGLAAVLWEELEEFLNTRIRDLERRMEVLVQLRERIKAVREFYEQSCEGDPETPWRAQAPCRSPSPRGAPYLRSGPVQGAGVIVLELVYTDLDIPWPHERVATVLQWIPKIFREGVK